MTEVFSIQEYNKFRHAAELRKDTHGGYLEGILPIPRELDGQDFELELSLTASSFSSRVEHPNLLHFTELMVGKKKRKVSAYKTEVDAEAWRTVFHFSGLCSEVHHYIKGEEGRNEVIRVADCRKDGSIVFGGDFGLTLTIITPLQNAGMRSKGVTISQVLENRYPIKSLDWLKNSDSHDPKIELHRCRIQAVFRSSLLDYKVSFLSNNIFDLSNKYVGRLTLLAIHNMEETIFALLGKKEVVLITKQKINPKEVFPDIMILSKEDGKTYVDPCSVYEGFSAISSDSIIVYHNTTLIFDIPAQNPEVLRSLSDETFFICLNRRIDRRLSDPIKSFKYTLESPSDFMATALLNNPDNNLQLPYSDSYCRQNIPSPAESGFISAEQSPSNMLFSSSLPQESGFICSEQSPSSGIINSHSPSESSFISNESNPSSARIFNPLSPQESSFFSNATNASSSDLMFNPISSSESGFISNEPVRGMYFSPLSPQEDLFKNLNDVDMTDLDLLSFPLDSPRICKDHHDTEGSATVSERKDIDLLTKIFEDSFTTKDESKDSEVKGFPTLSFEDSNGVDVKDVKDKQVLAIEENTRKKAGNFVMTLLPIISAIALYCLSSMYFDIE